jgi:hypothetical protein
MIKNYDLFKKKSNKNFNSPVSRETNITLNKKIVLN